MQLKFLFYPFLLLLFKQNLCFTYEPNNTIIRNKLKIVDDIIENLLDVIPEPKHTDCSKVKESGFNTSGIYKVLPLSENIHIESFPVYCDMETDGGGWTVFQRRADFGHPAYYFYRNWRNYSDGFGNLDEDFWLGNKKLHYLTSQDGYSLRIDMKDLEGNYAYAQYKEFKVRSENEKYKLHLIGYSGNATDSLSSHHNYKFTTFDNDNDANSGNCAAIYKNGWWNTNCHTSNLNGLYLNGPHEEKYKGVEWRGWKGDSYSLPFVEMKIRSYLSKESL